MSAHQQPPRIARPIRRTRPWSRAGLAVSIGVAVGAMVILFGVGAAAENIGRGNARPVADRPAPRSTAPAAGLRQPVRDGKFEFVVRAVDCSRSTVGLEHLKRTASGKYCVLSLTIRNIADRPQLFLSRVQTGLDAAGHEFTTDEAAGLFANRDTQTFLRKIDPGHQVSGKIVFDLPKKATLTTVELHDSYFSHGVRVTLS
jgi:uncharacterized protein DUF4352